MSQAPSALFHTEISVIRLQSQPSDCNLSNQSAISAIRLQSKQSFCNLGNQAVIFTIVVQFPQSDVNLSNHSAIYTIRLQSPQSITRFYHDLPLGVHIPECLKHLAHCFILQSQQSGCNLHNQILVSTIRLQ